MSHRFSWFALVLLLNTWVQVYAAIPKNFTGLDIKNEEPKQIDLKDARLATVVVFTSARCPCFADHRNSLAEIAKEYQPKGFQFIGIHSNADEPLDLAKRVFTQNSLPFTILRDENQTIADSLGAVATPHVFVLSPQGDVLYQGGMDDSHRVETAKKPYLKQALNAILLGQKPNPSSTRALGCFIQRR